MKKTLLSIAAVLAISDSRATNVCVLSNPNCASKVAECNAACDNIKTTVGSITIPDGSYFKSAQTLTNAFRDVLDGEKINCRATCILLETLCS
jgi:hypothetical protein